MWKCENAGKYFKELSETRPDWFWRSRRSCFQKICQCLLAPRQRLKYCCHPVSEYFCEWYHLSELRLGVCGGNEHLCINLCGEMLCRQPSTFPWLYTQTMTIFSSQDSFFEIRSSSIKKYLRVCVGGWPFGSGSCGTGLVDFRFSTFRVRYWTDCTVSSGTFTILPVLYH